jgi:hypothetical protein
MKSHQSQRQIIPKIIPAMFVVLLAGCGAPRPVTQEVNIPVFTPCVKAVPLKPDYEFGKLSLDAADGDKVLALARDWPRGRKYESELEAAIAGCL